MSDLSQGPGWWQASDGKWYPPESHPGYAASSTAAQPATPPAQVAPPPMAPPPMAPPPMAPPGQPSPAPGVAPAYGPRPQASKSSKGCIIALVIFLVLIIGFGAFAAFGLHWVGNQIENGSAFGKDTCDAISNADVNEVLGGSYTAVQLGGFTNIAAPALDSRVLPNGKTCWISPSKGDGRTIRVATSSTSDASATFAAEKNKATGTKQDRGNGLSVETQGYFGKDVTVGDEAFCTTSDVIGYAGVLVRQGNKLTYVSVNGGDLGTTGTPTASDITAALGNDNDKCDVAMKLAAKVN